MARGGRYSSIPFILYSAKCTCKTPERTAETTEKHIVGMKRECVFQLFRSISVGKNRPERAEKGENVCTKVILWNWQEEH